MQSEEETKETPKPKNVIEALLLVKRQIDALGVGKDKKTEAGPKYAYRSVDDVINAVGPMLTKAGVITSISYHDVAAEDVSIVNQRGESRNARRIACLQRVKFSHSNDDGVVTTLDTEAIGEGLDSGDKAANKAMSVAYKYALGLSLPIPFVGRDDPDAEQPVLAGLAAKVRPPQQGRPQEQPPATVDLPTYMSRIAQCLDINLLRGIVGEGMRQAAAAGDMDARTKIRDAGKLRADMLVEVAEGQSAEMDRAFKETVTEDGEVV